MLRQHLGTRTWLKPGHGEDETNDGRESGFGSARPYHRKALFCDQRACAVHRSAVVFSIRAGDFAGAMKTALLDPIDAAAFRRDDRVPCSAVRFWALRLSLVVISPLLDVHRGKAGRSCSRRSCFILGPALDPAGGRAPARSVQSYGMLTLSQWSSGVFGWGATEASINPVTALRCIRTTKTKASSTASTLGGRSASLSAGCSSVLFFNVLAISTGKRADRADRSVPGIVIFGGHGRSTAGAFHRPRARRGV